MRPRLDASGANLANVHLQYGLHLPADLDHLEKVVRAKRAKLIVIDPIAAHLDGSVRRFDDSIRRVSERLDSIAERYGCAIVVTDHVLKNVRPGMHPLQAIGGGSSGIPAASQMCFLIGRDPADEDRLILCTAKANLRDDPPPYAFQIDSVTFTDNTGVSAPAGLLEPIGDTEFEDPISMLLRPREEKVGPASKLADASEWLTKYLYNAPEHEAKASDVEEDGRVHGVKHGTLTRAKKEVKIDSFQRDREWWWRLPQELVDILDSEDGDDDGG
jgi:AAA domain